MNNHKGFPIIIHEQHYLHCVDLNQSSGVSRVSVPTLSASTCPRLEWLNALKMKLNFPRKDRTRSLLEKNLLLFSRFPPPNIDFKRKWKNLCSPAYIQIPKITQENMEISPTIIRPCFLVSKTAWGQLSGKFAGLYSTEKKLKWSKRLFTIWKLQLHELMILGT